MCGGSRGEDLGKRRKDIFHTSKWFTYLVFIMSHLVYN